MPLDDRDTKFEKALSRHLRAECPDAETLAAYHERELAPEEMIRWKKHIAGCGACQEILAQLEATESIPQAAEEMAVRNLAAARFAASKRAGARPGGRGFARLMQAQQMPKRTAPWKWAAPAGAIAAGLLVWLAVNEMRPPGITTQAPVQVAERRPEMEPTAPPSRNEAGRPREESLDRATANKLAEPESKVKVPSAAPEPSRAEIQTRALGKVQPQAQAGAKEQQLQTAQTFDDKLRSNVELRQQAQRKDETASLAGVQAKTANKPISGATESVEVTTAAAAPPLPPPAPAARDEKKKAAVGLMAGQAVSGGISSNYKQDGYLREADVSALRMIQSPDGKVTWRFGENGLILHSTEKTAGWQAQGGGVSVELTGGSAPNEKVCWIVGREGTILRTTDGGEHWKKISSPIVGDIGGVTATDATHAVVWDAASRQSYETQDGGVTWTAAVKP